MTGQQQDRICGDVASICGEALSIEELGRDVLPLLEKAVGASNSVVYRCRERNRIENVGGGLAEGGAKYQVEHYALDPMQTTMRRENPRILHGSRFPEWGRMVRLPVYSFLVGYEAANYLHIRLTDVEHHAPGMVGMILSRSQRQPDFGESDKLLLARLLPALEGLARRSVRVGGELALAEVARRAQLTAAETEVLGLLSRGLSDRQIARRRFVSPATVHTHVGRILAKLEVRSRVQAALLARGLDIEHDDEG